MRVSERRRQPEFSAELVSLPEPIRSPWLILVRRLSLALLILFGVAALVYFGRAGYVDSHDPEDRISALDALYYSTVSLTTTGYGDITPVSDRARALTVVLITPARIAFLVLLIGATVEVLATQSRQLFRVARWRKRMGGHVIVVGYGSKGRSAVETLVSNEIERERIIVVDPTPQAVEDAQADGLAVITGDATRRDVLRRAGVESAERVIIATSRDDSNVLVALTVRRLNPDATVIASVRDQDNAPLLRQSGVDSVITSSDAVGRLLGLSTLSPTLGTVLEDLLSHGAGLEVTERELLITEVGKQPQSLPDQVIAVVRDERVHRYFDPAVSLLARGDRLIVVRPAQELPWAPRPGTHDEARADEEV